MDVASIHWPFELGMKCGSLILIIGKHKLLDGMQPDLVSGGMGWAYIGYNPCPWMPPRSDTRDARVATTITIGIDYMHNQNATCTQTFKIGNTCGGQDRVGQQREYGLTVYPVKEGNRSRQHFVLQFCKINCYILVNILGLKFFFLFICVCFSLSVIFWDFATLFQIFSACKSSVKLHKYNIIENIDSFSLFLKILQHYFKYFALLTLKR